jgi:hypothetical protein
LCVQGPKRVLLLEFAVGQLGRAPASPLVIVRAGGRSSNPGLSDCERQRLLDARVRGHDESLRFGRVPCGRLRQPFGARPLAAP